MNKTTLKKIASEISVSDFTHYRDWLQALLLRAKELESRYSYARFSTDLSLGSSNAHLILSGKRPLGKKAAANIAKALSLTGPALKYWEALINYEHAKTPAARDSAFSTLIKLKTKTVSELDKKQLKFFTNWYHAAILEMLRLPGSEDTPSWLAQNLIPKVSVPKIKDALQLLVELNYLAYDKSIGKLQPTDVTITTGDEVSGIALTRFHQQMIDIAKRSIDEQGPQEREIGAITLAIPSSIKKEIKAHLVAIRKKLIGIANSSDESKLNEIVQINMQMFSLGKASGEKSET